MTNIEYLPSVMSKMFRMRRRKNHEPLEGQRCIGQTSSAVTPKASRRWPAAKKPAAGLVRAATAPSVELAKELGPIEYSKPLVLLDKTKTELLDGPRTGQLTPARFAEPFDTNNFPKSKPPTITTHQDDFFDVIQLLSNPSIGANFHVDLLLCPKIISWPGDFCADPTNYAIWTETTRPRPPIWSRNRFGWKFILKYRMHSGIITCNPNHGSTSNSTSYLRKSASSQRPGDKPRTSKRDQNDHDGQSDEERDGDGARKRSKKDRAQAEAPGTTRMTWVCPFFRLDPFKHHACLDRTFQKVTHVKDHLCHCHVPASYCSNCWEGFSSESARDRHTRERSCSAVDATMGVDLTDQEQQQAFKRNRIPESVDGWNMLWEVSLSRVHPKPERSGRTPHISTNARNRELLETINEVISRRLADDTDRQLRELFPEDEDGRIRGVVNWREVTRIVSAAFVNIASHGGRFSPAPRTAEQPTPSSHAAARQIPTGEDDTTRPQVTGADTGSGEGLGEVPPPTAGRSGRSVAVSTTAPSDTTDTEQSQSTMLHSDSAPSTGPRLPKPTRDMGNRSSSAPSAMYPPSPPVTLGVIENAEETLRPALRQSQSDTVTSIHPGAALVGGASASGVPMFDVIGTPSTAPQQSFNAHGNTASRSGSINPQLQSMQGANSAQAPHAQSIPHYHPTLPLGHPDPPTGFLPHSNMGGWTQAAANSSGGYYAPQMDSRLQPTQKFYHQQIPLPPQEGRFGYPPMDMNQGQDYPLGGSMLGSAPQQYAYSANFPPQPPPRQEIPPEAQMPYDWSKYPFPNTQNHQNNAPNGGGYSGGMH